MHFPSCRYVSTEPDCPTGRKYLCISFLPEQQARKTETGKTRMVWAYGCAAFHYGATAQEAEQKLRAWIEGEREAFLKSRVRVSKAQRKIAQNRAKAARPAEIALFGLEPALARTEGE